MSDRARSSVRTETREGSGTSDGVPEAAAPVDDRPDAGAGTSPAAPHGSSAVQGGTAPAESAAAHAAPEKPARSADAAPAGGRAAAAKAAAPAAPAEAAPPPAPPAAHPGTPLVPPSAAPVRGADDAARPVSKPSPPVPPSTSSQRVTGARSGGPATGQVPIDSTQAVTLPPAGARPVDNPSRPAAARNTEAGARSAADAPAKARTRGVGRGPRRARLQLRHIDTWSALKISLVVSIALFFVWMIAVAVLYGVLGGLGVFDTLNDLIGQLSSTAGDEGATSDVISAGVVFGGAAVIGAVNIVLLTALCTIAAFVYNLCSDMVGGLELTLAERD